jgi:hypothetical protein
MQSFIIFESMHFAVQLWEMQYDSNQHSTGSPMDHVSGHGVNPAFKQLRYRGHRCHQQG